MHSVSRPPVWDGCRKCSALACGRRRKHWTHSTRDRRVKPRNQRTTPRGCSCFGASAPELPKRHAGGKASLTHSQACHPKLRKNYTRIGPASEVRSGHNTQKENANTQHNATRRSHGFHPLPVLNPRRRRGSTCTDVYPCRGRPGTASGS